MTVRLHVRIRALPQMHSHSQTTAVGTSRALERSYARKFIVTEGCAVQAEQAAPQTTQRTEEQLRHALQSIKV